MKLSFAKMHGLGNDFVMVDARQLEDVPSRGWLAHLGDRRRGIGCDQILLARPGSNGRADVEMDVYNADGGPAEQCGNGLRCFAVFCRRLGLVDQDELTVQTGAGILDAEILSAEEVRVAMGVPRLAPPDIPFEADAEAAEYVVDIEGDRVAMGAVSMGNPHGVIRVDDVDAAPVARLGPKVQSSGVFPAGVNVGFMQILTPTHVRLRVFERGVGETLACGSGAAAAVVAGRVQERLAKTVEVDLPGGRLSVKWPGPGQSVWMCGPVAHVFNGEIDI